MGARIIEVWCLLGRKAGDNTQVLALAEELGYGYRRKYVCARPWELLVHLRRAPTLAGIDRVASSALTPPWPDLVISAGRRNEPVARWLRQRSGGRCRLVHIGRPWAPLEVWDLVVTTPQYFLPRQPNVLHNTLPLHRLAADELAAAAASLESAVAHLPRPRIALLVGGDSGRFVMTPAKGERLGALANSLARAAGGSLLVSDSARTPALAGDALRRQLSAPHYDYRWADGGDNPYRAFLGLADAFVVTGESMSMLGEAAAMARPLFIFDLDDPSGPWWRLPHNHRYKPLSHRLAMRLGPARMRRDIGRIQNALVARGAASWLQPQMIESAGTALRASPPAPPCRAATNAELQAAAQAVRRLLTPD